MATSRNASGEGPMTRNQRRKAAKARLEAKQERFIGRIMAARLEENRAIVNDNLSSPKERNYYPQSNMAGYASKSHRGYVSAASGSMSKRSTLQVMSKVANKKSFDTYARPARDDDKSNWPIKQK